MSNVIDAKQMFDAKKKYDAIDKSIESGKSSGYHVNVKRQKFKAGIEEEKSILKGKIND